jgi:hypothetical protein
MAPNFKFELDGFTVSLIDTSGFDEFVGSESNLLKGIKDMFEVGRHRHRFTCKPIIVVS